MDGYKENVSYIEATPLRIIHDDAISSLRGTLPPHWHDEIELDLLLKGSVSYTTNGVSYELSEGDIFVVGSGAVHSGQCHRSERFEETKAEMLTFLLDNRLFAPYVEGDGLNIPPVLHRGENDALRETMTELWQAFTRRDRYYTLVLNAGAFKLCHQLLSMTWMSAGNSAIASNGAVQEIKTALTYMKDHCTEKLSLEEVAAVVNYNPSYFSRRFHQLTGFTFTEHLNHCRVGEAARLLRDTDSPVSDIAFLCGFSNSGSLITYFRRYYMTTPDKYRRTSHKVKNL